MYCIKPLRSVQWKGESLQVSLIDCHKCAWCKETYYQPTTSNTSTVSTTTPRKRERTERQAKRAFWRWKTSQLQIVEIVHIE